MFTDAAETTSARTGQAAILTDVEQLKYQPLKEGKNQIGYNRLNEVLRIEPGQFFGLSWELQKEAEHMATTERHSGEQGAIHLGESALSSPLHPDA